MALDQVRLGAPPSGSDGDDPRTAFTRINNNAKLLDDSGVSGPVSTAREVTSYNDATQQGRWIGIATASNRPPGFSSIRHGAGIGRMTLTRASQFSEYHFHTGGRLWFFLWVMDLSAAKR